MYRIRDLSIKQKLNTIVMLTTGTALFLGFVAFVAYDIMTSRQNIARNLSMMAEIVANNSTAALTFNDPKSAEEALAVFKANPHVQKAAIYDAHGRVFAAYHLDGSASGADLPAHPEPTHP